MPWLEELEWLAFSLPRRAVQELGRRLPLAELRDRLPRVIGDRLRMGLYPARVTDPRAVDCARTRPEWGEPAQLDIAKPVHFKTAPRVSILIVTYGNLDLNRLCLASVQRAADKLPFEVIVVDNASTDGTPQFLREAEATRALPMRVVLNSENIGFARANNQAAKLANGEYLVFLNNDTVVTPGWLETLIGHLETDSKIGLIGPVTNSCGNEAELGARYADLDAMERFAADYTRAHAGAVEDLAMLVLFCAAMPRALYEKIGGLDEQYRVGMFEDDDLACAVAAAGRRVVLARDAFVHHYGGAAFSRLPAKDYLRIWWENRRRFERKWGRAWQKR